MSIENMMQYMSNIACAVVLSLVLTTDASWSMEREPMERLSTNIMTLTSEADTAEFSVLLQITNHSNRTVTILNPDMGVPAPNLNWSWSNQTYQISMLLSFGYLSMSVIDETGNALPQKAIQTWATPVLQPKIELKPNDSFELAIPIGSFYQFTSGMFYQMVIEYGDQDMRVVARSSLTAP